MTIHSHALNEALATAEDTHAGLSTALAQVFDNCRQIFSGVGLTLPTDDTYREVECALFDALRRANPEHEFFRLN